MDPAEEAEAIERAIALLGKRGDRRRPFLRRELRRIVDRYREARHLDDTRPTVGRSDRLKALARLEHAARGLHPADALSVVLAAGLPADTLQRLAMGAQEVADDLPAMQGRPPKAAPYWLAWACVEIFSRNADDPPTAAAETSRFMEFLAALHALATPDPKGDGGADLMRPGRAAVAAWQAGAQNYGDFLEVSQRSQ